MHESSTSDAQIRASLARARALADRRVRDALGCFWIEGIRNFVQAYEGRFHFETIIYSPVLLKSIIAARLVRRLAAGGVPRVCVSPEQFRSTSKTERASGVSAIVRQRWTPLDDVQPASGLCWLIVERIRSPGNLGSIVRTAEACGAGGLVFAGASCDPYDPAVVRASMGGIFHVKLVRATHTQLAGWASARRVTLVGLSPEAERWWTALPAAHALAFVLGDERKGLSDGLRRLCHTTVRLPMCGRADSLNVSVAAGVMMFEMVRREQSRQRRQS